MVTEVQNPVSESLVAGGISEFRCALIFREVNTMHTACHFYMGPEQHDVAKHINIFTAKHINISTKRDK